MQITYIHPYSHTTKRSASIHMTSLLLLQSLPPKISSNPNPKIHRSPRLPPAATLVASAPPPSGLRSLRARCSASSDEARGSSPAEDVVSGMVEELLRREENRGLLDGLEQASRRVERAREALADIERQEAEARRAKEHVRRLESWESEIAESQRELLEARAMVDEAQRSLSFNTAESSPGDALSEGINKDVERMESMKAALLSSIIGSIAGAPISLYHSTSFGQLILHSIIIFISCSLFGVTFRYAIRRDLDNVHLKTGTCAAFGFVKGLAALGAGEALEPNIGSFISHSIDGAVYVSESIFIFLSASIALDFGFKMRLLSPFPIRK